MQLNNKYTKHHVKVKTCFSLSLPRLLLPIFQVYDKMWYYFAVICNN